MSQYKRMSLTFPFTLNEEVWFDLVDGEILPVFRKDGFYLDRLSKKTWLEIDGRAYAYSCKEDFDYHLAVNEGNNLLHEPVMKAIALLITNHLASRKQQDLYSYQTQRLLIRDSFRDTRKRCLRYKKILESAA